MNTHPFEKRNIKKPKANKNINCALINQPAIFAYFVILILAVIIYGANTDFFFLNEEMIPTFYLVVISAFLILFPWFVFKVKVQLRVMNGGPKIVTRGLISKQIFQWPFEFDMSDAFFLEYNNTRYGIGFDKIVLYDDKKSFVMTDNVYKASILGEIITERGIINLKLRTFWKHTGKALEIFWALKYFGNDSKEEKQNKRHNEELPISYSPFKK